MTSSLIELWLTFLAALLGSGHCIGMCGGLATASTLDTRTTRGEQIEWRSHPFWLPLLYTAGRLGTYMFLGGLTGWFGSMALLHLRPSPLFGVPHIAVGVIMILMGLHTIGLFSLGNATSTPTGWLIRQSQSLAGTSQAGRTVGLGILTGLLPCSLHWAFQAKAFASGSLVGGLSILLAFGLGTLPAMWGFALISTWLNRHTRQRILQIAGGVIVLLGILSLKRGIMMLQF